MRLTEEGCRAHERCEQAVTAYAFAVARRLSPDTLRSFTQDLVLFAQAVEEENEARRAYRTREVPLDLEHQGVPASEKPGRLEEILPFGLSGGDRQLLIWYYEDNLPHEEIARRLNCSVHACHMRLSRARGRCCRLLTKT